MHIRFLLGPAGSGKTFRCVTECRRALLAAPAGPPLLFLAPKQATFQLERQLLADPDLGGYTRLQILSFERLARFILDVLSPSPARLLSEEGRLMVLRALLAQHQDQLKLYRSTARLPGFALQLSHLLRELQQHQLGPKRLEALTARIASVPQLSGKLHDLGFMLQAYLRWLEENGIQDAASLLELAAGTLQQAARETPLLLGGLWLDGFGEMSPQELDLLAVLVPCCKEATLAFCLESEPPETGSWLSIWSVVGQTFRRCHQALASIPGARVTVEVLPRDPAHSRFAGNLILRHLEKSWSHLHPFAQAPDRARNSAEELISLPENSRPEKIFTSGLPESLRIARCANPEAEATLAAHEILRHVRDRGGRFREAAVLVRQLEGYHDALRRVFTRYEIPFFLDRRESLAHHPLAELTRSTLRLVAFGWRQEDWFAALKTGLVHRDEEAIDDLENEALARGWSGKAWLEPLHIEGDEPRARALEQVRQKLVPPFVAFSDALAGGRPLPQIAPTGAQLAGLLRQFWADLGAGETLRQWSDKAGLQPPHFAALHTAVWEQMHEWLDNLALAFPREALPLREWLTVLEAGLGNLTVGVVPPALDQVLIGAVDRSRNPDLQLAIVLGLNEAVFPAPPSSPGLLTETDRAALENEKVFLGLSTKHRLGHERFLGYIACTRARQRLVLGCSSYDAKDRKLNPSPFLQHVQQLFPGLEIEDWRPPSGWMQSEHASDLVAPLLQAQRFAEEHPALESSPGLHSFLLKLADLPVFGPFRERLGHFQTLPPDEALAPALAEKLYGPHLQTSVTRVEQFAACQFKFFVNSGLRAQERKRFEVDRRTLGDFQHQVLKLFHDEVRAESKHWRDLTPPGARQRISRIAAEHVKTFNDGLLLSSARERFRARQLTSALEQFIETIIGWMPQYRFDPVAVELRFHAEGDIPPWKLPLAGGQQLIFTGGIDRVDLLPSPDRSSALCVVIDYKSSARQVDRRLLENGVQLQLPAYLSVLRHLPNPERLFGVRELIPAGVFYVNLRGSYPRGGNRNEVFAQADEARKLAYRHTGRFDKRVLPHLDSRSKSLSENSSLGSTGDSPVPSGDSPDGTGATVPGNNDGLLGTLRSTVPVGGSPTGAGESPALPIFQTRSKLEKGDQFNFTLTKNGEIHGRCVEPLDPAEFRQMLDVVETRLKEMGEAIFRGEALVNPYRQGSATPCDYCEYQSICRIDPWTHSYRALRALSRQEEAS